MTFPELINALEEGEKKIADLSDALASCVEDIEQTPIAYQSLASEYFRIPAPPAPYTPIPFPLLIGVDDLAGSLASFTDICGEAKDQFGDAADSIRTVSQSLIKSIEASAKDLDGAAKKLLDQSGETSNQFDKFSEVAEACTDELFDNVEAAVADLREMLENLEELRRAQLEHYKHFVDSISEKLLEAVKERSDTFDRILEVQAHHGLDIARAGFNIKLEYGALDYIWKIEKHAGNLQSTIEDPLFHMDLDLQHERKLQIDFKLRDLNSALNKTFIAEVDAALTTLQGGHQTGARISGQVGPLGAIRTVASAINAILHPTD